MSVEGNRALYDVPKHLVESPSRIINYLLCPALQQEGRTLAMVAGEARHAIIERYIRSGGQMPDPAVIGPIWRELPPDVQQEVIEASARAVPHIPPLDTILSCEGSGLPRSVTYAAYGKRFAMVEIAPTYWLRGSADIVSDGGDILQIIDWKGREKSDGNEIQALCYALMYSAIYPGFSRVQVRFVYLGSGEVETLDYYASDIEQLRAQLVEIIARKRADTVKAPQQCVRCPSCVRFADCPEGMAKAAKPLAVVPTDPKAHDIKQAVATYALPATVDGRIDLWRRVKVAASVADALKDRLSDALKDDLADGPVVVDGREYRAASIGGRYYVSDQDAAQRFASDLGIDVAPILKLDTSAYTDAVEAAIKSREQAGEDVTHLRSRYDDTIRQATILQIRDRAAR